MKKKIEYLTETFYGYQKIYTFGNDLSNFLNKKGQEGWDLVSFTTVSDYQVFIFKRVMDE